MLLPTKAGCLTCCGYDYELDTQIINRGSCLGKPLPAFIEEIQSPSKNWRAFSFRRKVLRRPDFLLFLHVS